MKKGSILFFGNCYYNTYFLARELKKRGWDVTTLNFDDTAANQMFYFGQDIQFTYKGWKDRFRHLFFYLKALMKYDIFHFPGVYGIKMLHDWYPLTNKIPFLPWWWEIRLLKKLGKKIVHTNNSCHDGIMPSELAQEGYFNTCSICQYLDNPKVCTDKKIAEWSRHRNSVSDLMVFLARKKAGFNDHPAIQLFPEFYCLDSDEWHPDILIPANYRVGLPDDTVKIYHAVGNYSHRSKNAVSPKCTHIWLPIIDRLKAEGHKVELIFVNDVPSTKVKYYQAQADIVIDMLTYGWYGANIREAMMLGKPCIAYTNPDWKADVARELPEYANELPVVDATIDTAYDVLKDLVVNAEKRKEIGKKSREFAVKWHSATRAGELFDRVYTALKEGRECTR